MYKEKLFLCTTQEHDSVLSYDLSIVLSRLKENFPDLQDELEAHDHVKIYMDSVGEIDLFTRFGVVGSTPRLLEYFSHIYQPNYYNTHEKELTSSYQQVVLTAYREFLTLNGWLKTPEKPDGDDQDNAEKRWGWTRIEGWEKK